MTETMLRTALGEKILRHWREHCPQMVRDLERKGRLDQTVLEAQEYLGEGYDLAAIGTMAAFDDRAADMKAALHLFRPICQGRRFA